MGSGLLIQMVVMYLGAFVKFQQESHNKRTEQKGENHNNNNLFLFFCFLDNRCNACTKTPPETRSKIVTKYKIFQTDLSEDTKSLVNFLSLLFYVEEKKIIKQKSNENETSGCEKW